MGSINNIYIHTNQRPPSLEAKAKLAEKLKEAGFSVAKKFSADTELIICIGGDGTFLKAAAAYDFPQTPILGVNTGHLGFFQDFQCGDEDRIIELCRSGDLNIQSNRLLSIDVHTNSGPTKHLRAINDVAVMGGASRIVHLSVSIGRSGFIENFSGDGVLVSSSAGSTAYNYSLGGSIVDPRVDILQLTPMAPMNTIAYRSFTSSLVLPGHVKIRIAPEDRGSTSRLQVIADGVDHTISDINRITVKLSEERINLVRADSFDFWDTVESKFLK